MGYKDHRPKGNPFLRTADDWRAMAKKSHMCVACLHSQPEIWKQACPKCNAPQAMREYMPSAAELKRAAQLILLLKAGKITDLKFHPRYDLTVDGIKVCTYEADAIYTENGKQIVEDTKSSGSFIEPVAKIKIKLFNALHAKHGLSVKLHRDN